MTSLERGQASACVLLACGAMVGGQALAGEPGASVGGPSVSVGEPGASVAGGTGAAAGTTFAPPEPPADAQAQLHRAGVRFAPWPVKPTPLRGRVLCGAPGGVRITRGASGLRFSKPPTVNAAFALRLLRFETVMQEEAHRAFGRGVVRVEHLGTYNCRMMAEYPDWVSEHSFANAIDVAAFVLEGGRRVEVERDFVPRGRATRRPAALFLRSLARRLYEEDVMSCVLTPAFDRRHKNHFHLDGARYRVDGT